MSTLYLLLGGNLGDKEKIFPETRSSLEVQVGKIETLSHIYETEPWGFDSGDLFWNQIVVINTGLTSEEVLDQIQLIETNLGRSRNTAQYSSRAIDIDILFYGNEIIKLPNLIVPHPRIQERKFALIPMNEVAPEFIHPVFQKTISQLLAECTDQLRVEPIR
jgi:2-amino-4-hydroxy-6-hydroxymethyldihydropteridine diphosphokinase